MLSDALVHATLPCSDLERAKAFYAEKMGMTPKEEHGGGAFYVCGDGQRFLLFPSQGKASGSHTQLGFVVTDIDAEAAELTRRGVEFIIYPGLEYSGGVAKAGPNRAAWWNDSEGNLLGMIQFG